MQRETFKLDGAAELDRQLAALGEQVATEIGRDAVIASAEALRDAWAQGAPYDAGSRSPASRRYGHLRQNIKIGPVRNQNVHALVYKVFTGDGFWGYFIEYGTVRMPPHPWARPIVERMKEQLINIQVETLNAGIESVAGGHRGGGFGPVLPNGRNG